MNLKGYRYRLPEPKRRYFVILFTIMCCFLFLPTLLLNFFKKRQINRENIRKILIVRNDGLGDFIMSLPALHLLRNGFKTAHIAILIPEWQKELALASNIFDDIIIFEDEKSKYSSSPPMLKKLFFEMLRNVPYLRQKGFDLAIDMRGDMRNRIIIFLSGTPYRVGFDIGGMEYLLTHQIHYKKGVHEVEHFIDLISPYTGKNSRKDVEFSIPIPDADKEMVSQFLICNSIHFGENPLVIVHPVSRWPAKEWPKAKFAELCDRLINQCRAKIIMVAAIEDMESIKKVLFLMKEKTTLFTGTLLQLSALLKKADLFIGNDTAPMHMAALLKTPTIALFGPTDPEIYGPYGEGHSIVRPDIPCLCSSKKVCMRPERFCMNRISVDEVFGLTKKYINR